jgi:hypothetical protein
MAARRPEPLLGALGAVGGAVGLVAARCGGGACSACLACAVPAVGIVVAALVTGRGRRDVPPPSPCAPEAPGAGR